MAKSGTSTTVGRQSSAGTRDTREALVLGALVALKEVGYAGASAREIAKRAGCNQGLVFYHFGSVVELLLAALDEVSDPTHAATRLAVTRAQRPAELVAAAAEVFREDMDNGYVAVLVEMIAGASATPGLGAEVVSRIAPWQEFAPTGHRAGLSGSPWGSLVPAGELSHAVVALYLGLELLSHLEGDRSRPPPSSARPAARRPLEDDGYHDLDPTPHNPPTRRPS